MELPVQESHHDATVALELEVVLRAILFPREQQHAALFKGNGQRRHHDEAKPASLDGANATTPPDVGRPKRLKVDGDQVSIVPGAV